MEDAVQPIEPAPLQQHLDSLTGADLYMHLETTRGAYTEGTFGAFARNLQVRFVRAGVAGDGPFRVALKTTAGWVHAEGLTHWEIDDRQRLLLAGHDAEGRLTVALQLSSTPFPL